MAKLKYDPNQDGITHLNIYSKGATEIGRFLSNFAKSEIITPDGNFLSVEGYWHWLGIANTPQKDVLRYAYGYKAKQVGTQLKNTFGQRFDNDFENKIINAITYKLDRNKKLLIANKNLLKLPIVHYYTFPDKQTGKLVVVDMTEKYKWMIDAIRKYIDKI